MEENTYNNSVKMIAGKNREIKLHGGSRDGRNQDPRKFFNDKEVAERDTELEEKILYRGYKERSFSIPLLVIVWQNIVRFGCDQIENKFYMGCDPIETKVLIGL